MKSKRKAKRYLLRVLASSKEDEFTNNHTYQNTLKLATFDFIYIIAINFVKTNKNNGGF